MNKHYFLGLILALSFLNGFSQETRVIPLVLDPLDMELDAVEYVVVAYFLTPDSQPIFEEMAEKIWRIQDRPLLILGSTGVALPSHLVGRAELFVKIFVDGQPMWDKPHTLHPQKEAIAISPNAVQVVDNLKTSLSKATSLGSSYLAELANYLAGNLSAINMTATSYSVEGYGEVIDSSGTWTGNPIGSDIWTDNGTDVFLTGRNIGIGTSAPEGKFHLFESSQPLSMILENENLSANLRISAPNGNSNLIFEMGEYGSGSIYFRRPGAPSVSAQIGYVSGGSLNIENTDGGNIGLISYFGKTYILSEALGIGTSNPQATTHITKNRGMVDLLVESVNADSIVNINAGVGAYSALTFSNDSSRMAEIGYSPSDDMLYFQNDNGGSVYFLTDKFGLGTSNPSTKFHLIESNDSAIAQVESKNGRAALYLDATSGNSEVQFQISDGYRGAFGYNATNDNLYLYHNGSVVVKDGKLGVGTQNPAGKLDVNGAIYQRGGLLHADYVFQDDYRLESILEHAEFMWREKHLPAVPAARVDETGREIVEVGQHQRGILEELEKAHIYIEQLHREIQELRELVTK